MRIAIHQPNFVPWYPFFQKMAAVDKFVLLTFCQYEKGKYQNRFRLHDQWHTMSVEHGMVPIRDKRYVAHQADWARIKKALPQYAKILNKFDPLVSASLTWTNAKIIGVLTEMLRITTTIVMDTPNSLTGTDRLIGICRQHGADTYLAGKSGADYLDLQKFEEAGIKVEHQDLTKADTRHTLQILHELPSLQ